MQTVAAAVTMVRDDAFFLSAWLRHYGGLLGRENCYIVNHGRGDVVAELAAGANVIGIPGDPHANFDMKRWRLLNNLVQGLRCYYDHVIVGDVDELVVVDDHSGDATARVAQDAGARVVDARTTLPAFTFQVVGALRGMNKDLLEMVMSFRPKRHKYFSAMVLPAVLPEILTAWKVNLGNASRVVVVAELVGSSGGVGYQLLQQQQEINKLSGNSRCTILHHTQVALLACIACAISCLHRM